MNSEMRLVRVGSFDTAIEAQLAKGMLESAGIECFLRDEHSNAIRPVTIPITLQVRESDEGSACDLLSETRLPERQC